MSSSFEQNTAEIDLKIAHSRHAAKPRVAQPSAQANQDTESTAKIARIVEPMPAAKHGGARLRQQVAAGTAAAQKKNPAGQAKPAPAHQAKPAVNAAGGQKAKPAANGAGGAKGANAAGGQKAKPAANGAGAAKGKPSANAAGGQKANAANAAGGQKANAAGGAKGKPAAKAAGGAKGKPMNGKGANAAGGRKANAAGAAKGKPAAKAAGGAKGKPMNGKGANAAGGQKGKPTALTNQQIANEVAAEVARSSECYDSEVVVRFDHVTKTYHLYKSDRGRLLSVFSRHNRSFIKDVHANNDISFEIKRGEAVCLVGHNGAGKSTALKMISGVSSPTSGTVEVNGSVSALLELGAGFDANLTGRENIELRSHVMAYNKEQMARLTPAAIEFADLGPYIDQPVRTYSSGMRARLGFALAVAVSPDILIVDEALAVGDAKFKKKCIDRIKEIMADEKVTVLFVTHSNALAKKFCHRGLVLNSGCLMFDGPIDDALKFYDDSIKD